MEHILPGTRQRIHLARLFRWIHHATVVLAVASAMAGATQAAIVTVDGAFLSFTSWIGTDRTSYVNGTALTAGASVAANRYQSDPVNFTAPTTQVDFNYDRSVTPFLVNTFEFIAAPAANVNPGDTFQLGTIRFINGQWWEQADLAFQLTTHSANPALDNQVYQGTLRLLSVSSPFPIDPYAEADLFYVLARPDLGSMRVFDKCCQPPGSPGYSGDFALYGTAGPLGLTGYVALNGGGFTNPSVQPGLAGPTAPEPGTFPLLAIGIGLLGAGVTLRRNTLCNQKEVVK